MNLEINIFIIYLKKDRNEFIIDTIYSLELDQSDLKSNGFEQFRFLDRCETFKYKKVGFYFSLILFYN